MYCTLSFLSYAKSNSIVYPSFFSLNYNITKKRNIYSQLFFKDRSLECTYSVTDIILTYKEKNHKNTHTLDDSIKQTSRFQTIEMEAPNTIKDILDITYLHWYTYEYFFLFIQHCQISETSHLLHRTIIIQNHKCTANIMLSTCPKVSKRNTLNSYNSAKLCPYDRF